MLTPVLVGKENYPAQRGYCSKTLSRARGEHVQQGRGGIMPKARKTREIARSAEDGRFVTKRYAEKHPKTTVVERIKNPPPKRRTT